MASSSATRTTRPSYDFANTKRRHLLFYVTRTGFKDEQNKRQPLDRPVVSGQYLSSTNKLAGVIGSGIDVLVGNGAYQPSHSDPLPLPVLPLTAKKLLYHVTVVGPGINQAGLPALSWTDKTGATEMLSVSFVKDLFVPFLIAGLDVHLNLDGLADPDKLNKLFKGARGVLTLGGPVVHVGSACRTPRTSSSRSSRSRSSRRSLTTPPSASGSSTGSRT